MLLIIPYLHFISCMGQATGWEQTGGVENVNIIVTFNWVYQGYEAFYTRLFGYEAVLTVHFSAIDALMRPAHMYSFFKHSVKHYYYPWTHLFHLSQWFPDG